MNELEVLTRRLAKATNRSYKQTAQSLMRTACSLGIRPITRAKRLIAEICGNTPRRTANLCKSQNLVGDLSHEECIRGVKAIKYAFKKNITLEEATFHLGRSPSTARSYVNKERAHV